MAAEELVCYFLGLAILLVPVLFHAYRCRLLTGFDLKKLRWTLDQSILFQGGFALVVMFPLMFAGFKAMGGHQFDPMTDLILSVAM